MRIRLESFSNAAKIVFLLRKIRIRSIHILIPIALALLASIFEGVGIGLLIPILNGFLQKSFVFVTQLPVLGPLLQKLPPGILENDRLVFAVLMVGFIVVYILKNTLRFLSVVSMAYLFQRTLHHLRKQLFSRYLSFGKFFFDTTNIGHHSTLLQDFSFLSLQPLASADRFINSLFSLVTYLVVILMISWKLTLVALPLFILLHFTVRSLILSIKRLSRSIVEQAAELNKRSVEILSTMPLVKAYRTERMEQSRYTGISDTKARLDFKENALHAVLLPLQEIITILAAAGVFMGALYLFGREQIASGPALIVYFYVIVNSASKFGLLSGYRAVLAAATGPLDMVLAVFDDRDKAFVESGTETFPGLQSQIVCQGLTFSYGEREVLTDVSFTIEKGKMTAIVGPTGAGKSTLISILMRYYDCPPGTVLVDGKDVRSFTLDSWLAHTAVVSQETLLLHDSLRNNITYGLEQVSEERLKEVVTQARLDEYIKQLPDGLETLIGDRGVKLSGGEKQRVSIARALLKGAEILILDEATSSLDSRTEKLIQEAIDDAITGRTAIVIAHRLSTIKHADAIVALQDGRVAEQGTLADLLAKKGLFFTLWEEQKF